MKRIIALFLFAVTLLSLFSCTPAIVEPTVEETAEDVTETKTEKKTGLPPVKELPRFAPPSDYLPERLATSIQAFSSEKKVKGQILFYGHSHFTRWKEGGSASYTVCGKNLEDMVTTPAGNKPCINHGFGSSTLYDLCYYYAKAVRPWAPKALVITAYANDGSFTEEQELVLLKWLLDQVTADFPECKVFITDFPPYPKMYLRNDGGAYIKKWTDYNEKAKTIISKYENVTLIEMSKWECLYKNKKSVGTYLDLDESLYLPEDHVHFTPKGYEVIAKEYQKVLHDVLVTYDN